MTKGKKILFVVTTAVFVIAVIISFFIGLKQGIRVGGLSSSLSELIRLQQQITEQMANASCDGVKQAVNDYLNLIERYKGVEEVFITSYYSDKMIAHLTLARIDNYLGNHKEATKHMELAQEACVHRYWEDCSTERLIEYSKQHGNNHPLACLENNK